MPLILASASPRRSELLRNAGIRFVVEPADVPELQAQHEKPVAYVQRLARDKAMAVFQRNPQSAVLGADTVVVADEHLLEKPADERDAARMLRLLSGRTHQVITGACMLAPSFEHIYEVTEFEVTQVVFATLTSHEIADYVATREPMDKAGAYGIQGFASRWVERIDGCYFNVVGLPIARVYRMLRACEAATGLKLL